jgi:hypothetical protein
MAIGIYASLYVLSKFKERIPFAPRVNLVGFSDGLFIVTCARALTAKDTLVKLRASFGTILAQVEVESYDDRKGVYRLSVENHELLIAQLPDERREAVRLPRRLPIRTDLFGTERLMTEDLSETGMRIRIPEVVEPDTNLMLFLELGALQLRLEATVCWSALRMDGSAHCGVHFLNISNAQQYNIRCYVEDHLKKERAL